MPTNREQVGDPVLVTVGREETSGSHSEPNSARRAYSLAAVEEAMRERGLDKVSAEKAVAAVVDGEALVAPLV